MNRHDDHFSPDHVDEQIEQVSWESSPVPAQSGPAKDLLRAMHLLYEEEKKEDTRSLDRAWSRIAAVDDQQQRNRSQNTVRSIMMKKEPGTFSITQFDRPLRQPLTQRFAILAAVACLAILVGGAVFLFHTMPNGRNTNTGGGGPFHVTSTATPAQGTPTPVGPGQVTPTPVGPGQVTPTPVSPGQVTPTPVGPGQVTPTPVSPGQVTPTPVGPGQVTPIPVGK